MMKKKATEVDEEADLRYDLSLLQNSDLFLCCREAFKLFDRNRDGYIDMKELKKVRKMILEKQWFQYVEKVTSMLGTMLTKEELEEFMREADVVNWKSFWRQYAFMLYKMYLRMAMGN